MTVRDQRDVAATEHRQHARDDPIGPQPDVRRSLAGLAVAVRWHAVAPQRPAGQDRSNLRRGQAFVAAVVPLDEVGVGLDVRQPGELRGFLRANQRTRKNQREAAVGDETGDACGLFLTERTERDVGATGVLATGAPFGGAVPQAARARREAARVSTDARQVRSTIDGRVVTAPRYWRVACCSRRPRFRSPGRVRGSATRSRRVRLRRR